MAQTQEEEKKKKKKKHWNTKAAPPGLVGDVGGLHLP